jgi:hypothetical protein
VTEEPHPSEALKREQLAAAKDERAAHEAADQELVDNMEKAHARRQKTIRTNTRQGQRGAIAALGRRLSRFLGRRGAGSGGKTEGPHG